MNCFFPGLSERVRTDVDRGAVFQTWPPSLGFIFKRLPGVSHRPCVAAAHFLPSHSVEILSVFLPLKRTVFC